MYRSPFALLVALAGPSVVPAQAAPATIPDLGSRRELFVDHFLIDTLDNARLRLHHPRRAGVALAFDKPWEGDFSGYVTVIQDGDRYRMYYRGMPKVGADGTSVESTCYAESPDGIRWTKPELGLFEVDGSRANNIILRGFAPASHNFSPFLDHNPQAAPEARFKALGGSRRGLRPFVSADGVRWKPLRDRPVVTGGAFDSQNVSFWSATEQCYVCYFRTWDGHRTISRATSQDFVTWTKGAPMGYGGTPREHLYTNQTHPYFRAPHIYLGIAARFMPGRRVLTPAQAAAIQVSPRYAGDCSDAVLLSSRGGTRYDRTFMEAYLRPGRGHANWVSRTNYPALGIVPTGDVLSIYVQKNYGQPTARLDRYSIRPDGFAALHGPYAGGTMTTKVFRFEKLSAQTIAERSRGRVAPVAVTAERPISGRRSLRFTGAGSVRVPASQNLRLAATLAVTVRDVPAGHRRLFSSYDGGKTAPRELILDVNSGGAIDGGDSIRFFYDGIRVGAPFAKVGDWSKDGKPHHIAVTWDDGVVTLYFDGAVVGRGGKAGAGAIDQRRGDLRFGEDYPPTSQSNEPFLGTVDDLTVLRLALTAAQVEQLARGVRLALPPNPAGPDLLYDFEPGSPTLPPASDPGWAAQQLLLNFATSAAGSVRVEIQDAAGRPIPGFRLDESVPLVGDELARAARWRRGRDVSSLGGRPIRLRFVLQDADVFALQFR